MRVPSSNGIVVQMAAWMFDPVACAAMTVGSPLVPWSVLVELSHRLSDVLLSEASSKEAAIVREECNEEAGDRRDVAVRAAVGSGARISFVGAVGRRQTVDFGELADGKTSPPIFLDVRSTADFEIRLTSEERGDLVQRADGKVWRVPYSTRIDGDRVDLDRVNSAGRSFSGPTDPAGQRLPLTFQLGSIGDQRAGSYRDRITIEVFPASR